MIKRECFFLRLCGCGQLDDYLTSPMTYKIGKSSHDCRDSFVMLTLRSQTFNKKTSSILTYCNLYMIIRK